MSRNRVRKKSMASLILVLAVLACNVQTRQPQSTALAPTETSRATEPPASATAQSETAIPLSTPKESATVTSGPPPVVTISAVGGRLNVRRGPGPEYDTVGAFLDGQSSVAIARNGDTTWLLINAPTGTKSLGWVIITTKYTAVKGAAAGLPVQTVPPALPAYIRNCTPHEMLVNPVGIELMSRNDAPDNQAQFFPGEYTVIDLTSETELAGITVFEGRTIEIKKDSSGSNFNCP